MKIVSSFPMNPIFNILSGTWFIISTNFPMWLDGSKTNPTFTYTVSAKNDRLIDLVSYQKNGKTKTINGFDYHSKENEKAFTWRGKGLLRIAKSNWEIRLIDEKEEWAVIWFSKTLFTPEGVDIISKNSKLDNAIIEKIKTQVLNDSLLKRHVGSLVNLPISLLE
ncbi:hypothetical protein BH10BAC1_BH10BAC1_17480 [soil metagenome]